MVREHILAMGTDMDTTDILASSTMDKPRLVLIKPKAGHPNQNRPINKW
jgi:hypothetical protein